MITLKWKYGYVLCLKLPMAPISPKIKSKVLRIAYNTSSQTLAAPELETPGVLLRPPIAKAHHQSF